MANAVIAALQVTLGLNAAQFNTGLANATSGLATAGARMQSVGNSMVSVGTKLSVALTAPIVAFGIASSAAAIQAANAMAQVEAALVSTGNKAGFTGEQLADMAEGLMKSSLFDDDDIMQDVTAGMLRFGAISGDVFARAQQVAVDYAARTGKALDASTTLVGKALNNPAKAAGALSKVGITLSKSQEEALKSMVKVGNMAGAQALVLGLLEGKYAGAAEAAQNTDPYNKLADSLGTLQENFGAIVNDYLAPFVDKVAALAERFNGLSPAMQNFIVIGAGIAAAIGPILVAVGSVVGALGSMAVAFGTGGALAGILPMLGPIGLAVAAVAVAFYVFRDEIVPVLQSFGAAIQEHVGPKLKPLFEAVVGLVQSLGAVFSAMFSSDTGTASQNLMAFGEVIAQVFGAAVSLITGAINTISQIMRAISAALNGDWSTMWKALGSAVGALVTGILNAFEGLFPGVIGSVRKMVEGVRDWFGAKLTGIFTSVIDRVKGVSDAFFRMYDAVVGHSYVPDMVEGVGHWMAKLQGLMVDPAVKGTRTTAQAFEDMANRARAAMSNLLTDKEKLDLDFAQQMKDLAGIKDAATRAIFERRALDDYARASGGIDAEGMTLGTLPQLREIEVPPSLVRFFEHQAKLKEDMKETIAQSREDFADAFSYGIEAAMHGDWASVLQTIVAQIFGGTLQDSLTKLGGSLFDKIGAGTGGKGIDLGGIGKFAASIFGKIPGFATGGSFRVGGAGAVDSKLVSMRLTPGEMVDIRRPGQLQAANNNAPINIDMRGAVMTEHLLGQMQGMAAQSGGNALRTARTAVPADRAKSDKYRYSR